MDRKAEPGPPFGFSGSRVRGMMILLFHRAVCSVFVCARSQVVGRREKIVNPNITPRPFSNSSACNFHSLITPPCPCAGNQRHRKPLDQLHHGAFRKRQSIFVSPSLSFNYSLAIKAMMVVSLPSLHRVIMSMCSLGARLSNQSVAQPFVRAVHTLRDKCLFISRESPNKILRGARRQSECNSRRWADECEESDRATGHSFQTRSPSPTKKSSTPVERLGRSF